MQEKELASVIEPILAEHGLELDGLHVTPIGRRSVLRVTVDGDGPEGQGPLLDDIAEASSAISIALDASTAVGSNPYTLEVSSRGVSAPLTSEKHFRRNTGRLVKAWLTGGDVITGRIAEVAEGKVTLELESGTKVLALDDLTKAVVQVELNRLPKDDGREA